METLDQTQSTTKPFIPLLGLLLALGVPCLPISRWVDEFANVTHLVLHEIIWWIFVICILIYIKEVEQRDFDSIGFRKVKIKDLFIAMLAAIAITISLAVIYFYILPAMGLGDLGKFDQLLATPFWWRLISVVRAGVSEEIMFRGYAMERVKELTGSKFVAAAISLTAFTFAHVPVWGWGHLFIAGFGGLMFTLLYFWKRNIWINIIAHSLVDAIAVLA